MSHNIIVIFVLTAASMTLCSSSGQFLSSN